MTKSVHASHEANAPHQNSIHGCCIARRNAITILHLKISPSFLTRPFCYDVARMLHRGGLFFMMRCRASVRDFIIVVWDRDNQQHTSFQVLRDGCKSAVYVCMNICMSVCMRCMYVCMTGVCMCVKMNVRMYAGVCVLCMYKCVYTGVDLRIYMYRTWCTPVLFSNG